MEQEITAGNQQIPFNAVAELTVIKENIRTADTNIYVQILRALPGSIPAANISTPFLNLPLDKPLNRLVKRTFDIFFSSLVIVGILSWLIPIMALFIKSDSRGPVFFFQKRNKRNARIFTCIKFRSMIVNAEADVLPASKNDKRITTVGKFMRKNFIDELPQFLNVFWGDMSIIGPRPHMLSDNMKYEGEVEYYACRHKVKPGITGLAQVMGFIGSTDELRKMKDRVNMDNFYLRHWSFKLDLVILYHTIFKSTGC
jgi:putative colanic acid biosysnthesis UDP-glucose lipid carrier transferase